MQTLLLVAVVLITLAVIVQAGVLAAMFLMSRKVVTKADELITDSKKLMAPLESVTGNLKSLSNDLAETGKMARAQVQQVQEMVGETRDTVRGQLYEVREKVIDTVDEARDVMMRPIRHYSAIAVGIAVGLRTFFSGRKETKPTDAAA